ncbi:hypothetical protein AB5N96_08640 [Chryseomicrobium imtechense]
MNDYKLTLMLHYFNTADASYSYNELLRFFGVQNDQLDEIINMLLGKGYLYIDGYLKLTDKGLKKINEYSLADVKFDEMEEVDIFNGDKIEMSEIYIPKRFNSKYK